MGSKIMLRRTGLGVLVGAALLAPAPGIAGPALVFEPFNGTVFYAEDPDKLWFPASLTKLMTAYVVFQALKAGKVKPDTPLVCSKNAASQAPTKLGLPIGGQITVDDALKVLIVKSANDVAVMLAEKVSGSVDAFVNDMNDAALRLGMTRTRFVNPNGLPGEGQMTTARDLAKLSRAIIVDYPEYAEVFALPSVQVGKKVMRSHNGLLRTFAGADGMKTGFICDSGFNVVASATRDGRRLVAVVLGEPSVRTRSDRAANLLENGFKRYFWKSVFGTTVDGLAVQASLSSEPVHLREDVCGPGRLKREQRRRTVRIKPKAKAKGSTSSRLASQPN
jgi:D-alanyl-D-alanine carboxypeptidase